MFYFAYGSNLDCGQMRERCPSAKFYGIAELRDHRLAFTRSSQTRRCGVADVVPEKGMSVWGVVYEIGDEDLGSLDRAEGYKPGKPQNSYIRQECQVFINGRDDSPLTVGIYIACKEQNPPLPSKDYKNQILGGARFWRLPEAYIKDVLEPIKVA